MLKDHVMVTLDTTGPSLFKRGYRLEKGGAPLKENMAAALVMLTNWRKDRPFYDPVCGSGTLCIEAALIGHNIAPGFNREFACESWDWFSQEIMENVRSAAEEKADYDIELDITGSDINGRMIEIAKANAEEIGLGSSITFKQQAVKDFKTDKEYGVIVANPPYGERLGEEETVRKLYKEMGDVFRPLKTWSKYILTSDLAFEEFYGQKATKKENCTMVHCVRIYSSIGELVRLEKRERRIILLIDSFNWMFGGIGNERKRVFTRSKRNQSSTTSFRNPRLGYTNRYA